jgi:hypothetical protein
MLVESVFAAITVAKGLSCSIARLKQAEVHLKGWQPFIGHCFPFCRNIRFILIVLFC